MHIIRGFLQVYYMVLSSLFILLLLASWVMSIYVEEVEGLLTPQGIRWMCVNIVANFSAVPLAAILLGLMVCSVFGSSGILKVFHGHMSLKQRRALQVTTVSLLAVLLVFSLMLFLPHAILLSAFGTISNSPLTKGAFGLLSCVMIVLGNIYGYTSGTYVSFYDFVHAHVAIFASVSGYFVLLFLASQFVGCLDYTGILRLTGHSTLLLLVMRVVFYYVPLLLYVLQAVFIPHSSHFGR